MLAKKAIFWKTTNGHWQSAVAKPPKLGQNLGYLWKDDIHIFHLAPSFSLRKSEYSLSCCNLPKEVDSSGTSRNIDPSPVLSYSTHEMLSVLLHHFAMYYENESNDYHTLTGAFSHMQYCSVLFKWKFFFQMRASCLPLSFHQKEGQQREDGCRMGHSYLNETLSF